jgi:SAM-dependent methyltransferase
VDRSEAAVAAARTRLARFPHVRVGQWALPAWPARTFDLVVLSEVGYYFDEPELAGMLAAAVDSLEPGGHLVTVHWRHPVPEYPRTGDDVHAAVAGTPGLQPVARHRESDFALDVFARTPPEPRSVADLEGLT